MSLQRRRLGHFNQTLQGSLQERRRRHSERCEDIRQGYECTGGWSCEDQTEGSHLQAKGEDFKEKPPTQSAVLVMEDLAN